MSPTDCAVTATNKIPVLLLKTKSTPHDGYDEYFGASEHFTPQFVPVLQHSYNGENLQKLKTLLTSGRIYEDGNESYGVLQDGDSRYGGIIFTSQRAVEAFTQVVVQEVGSSTTFPLALHQPHPLTTLSLPLYVVGPATSRALTSLRDTHLPNSSIHGATTGNGENLARFILTHYNTLYPPSPSPSPPPSSLTTTTTITTNPSQNQIQIQNNTKPKPSLLFLVGEQRRAIIPQTLNSALLPASERIGVDEWVVYETGVMASFPSTFSTILAEQSHTPLLWVVVFSPTGCEAMLRALGGLGDDGTTRTQRGHGGEEEEGCEKGETRRTRRRKGVYVATIGPTTREFLEREFGFEVDVCAERPSPEGVGEGMRVFMEENHLLERGGS